MWAATMTYNKDGTEPRFMKTCPVCDSECVERHVFEDITWGTDGRTKHGRHIFKDIEQRYFECLKCGEAWCNMEQAHFKERNLNEAIKTKLGFDWLAESAVAREARKEENQLRLRLEGKIP